jgi:hypothetical protein
MTLHARRWFLAALAVLLAAPLLAACATSGGDNPNAPTVQILLPAEDTEGADVDWTYDGFDEDRGQWFKEVTLVGDADDVEDGSLSGASLVWTTDRDDQQAEVLGTGATITVRLHSDDCFGVEHVITLTATDSGGKTATAVRRIFIWTVC